MKLYPYSSQVARLSGSNFYYSFFFLPRERRDAIMVVYAFSRIVDDTVDEALNEEEAKRGIETWRERLSCCYDDQFEFRKDDPLFHPILLELLDVVRRFHIPKQYFLDLLKGVEMDLNKRRYSTFSELENYCYHVAGTIGLLCNQLFGLHDERGRQYGILLGTAFQLTNILRDIDSDRQRGRIYLPLEDLARFGVSEEDVMEGRASDNFRNLMHFETDRAWNYFQRAEEILHESLRKKIIPSEMMSAFYKKILSKLEKQNFPVFKKKVSLSKAEKVYLVGKTLVWSQL